MSPSSISPTHLSDIIPRLSDKDKMDPGIDAANRVRLKDQHRVAVAVEPIAPADGLGVGLADQVHAGQGGDEDEEAAAGEVEVGEQGVEAPEGVAGAEVEGGLPREGRERAAAPRRV